MTDHIQDRHKEKYAELRQRAAQAGISMETVRKIEEDFIKLGQEYEFRPLEFNALIYAIMHIHYLEKRIADPEKYRLQREEGRKLRKIEAKDEDTDLST